MPINLSRNLHLCFTKLRMPTTNPTTDKEDTTTTTVTAAAKNYYNSIYDVTSASTSKSLSRSSDFFSSSASDDSDDATTSPPDFAAAFSSQRFFFSSPGRSNSIFHSKDYFSPESDPLVIGGVPFQTYSPDPYLDFRRSMQEMVGARELVDVRGNWDGLHELLSCYLDLNPKHIHKFIIRAFADLLLSLAAGGGCPESDIPGRCFVIGNEKKPAREEKEEKIPREVAQEQ